MLQSRLAKFLPAPLQLTIVTKLCMSYVFQSYLFIGILFSDTHCAWIFWPSMCTAGINLTCSAVPPTCTNKHHTPNVWHPCKKLSFHFKPATHTARTHNIHHLYSFVITLNTFKGYHATVLLYRQNVPM